MVESKHKVVCELLRGVCDLGVREVVEELADVGKKVGGRLECFDKEVIALVEQGGEVTDGSTEVARPESSESALGGAGRGYKDDNGWVEHKGSEDDLECDLDKRRHG